MKKLYYINKYGKQPTRLIKGQEFKNGLIYQNNKLIQVEHNAVKMSFLHWTWEFYIKQGEFIQKFKNLHTDDLFDIRILLFLLVMPIIWPILLITNSLSMQKYLSRDEGYIEEIEEL